VDRRRQLPCRQCGRYVTLPRGVNLYTILCARCLVQRGLKRFLGPHGPLAVLSQRWARSLLERYAAFLERRGYSSEHRLRVLRTALALCLRMEEELPGLQAFSAEWLDSALASLDSKPSLRPSFVQFLREEGLLPEPDKDERWLRSIAVGVARVHEPFRRLVDHYTQFRVRLREEQRRQNLSHVLNLRTVRDDVRMLHRFVRYLERERPQVTFWETVTQDDVVRFLQSLPCSSNSRHVVRWDLHSFFRFCLRHRFVAHNPVPGERGREGPPSFRPLPFDEQRRLLERWSHLDDPQEALMGCLGLLHGLSTGDLRRLRLADVDLQSGRLRVHRRTVPMVLDRLTRQALATYLEVRRTDPARALNPHLFTNQANRYHTGPVSQRYLAKYVKRRAGVTQQQLRWTCLAMYAQESGPRLLIDALGLSPPQAGRYQNFLAYRADQALVDFPPATPDH
jgi:integrase